MNNYIKQLNKQLKIKLHSIEQKGISSIEKSKESAECIDEALTNLKSFISSYLFSSKEEEIYFFKYIKPEILSKLIYHEKIYNIESNRPLGNAKTQETFIRNELDKLTFFFYENKDFYRYWRTQGEHLDDRYFTRYNKMNLNLYSGSLKYHLDNDFSTSHDYLLAEILANDRVNIFLKNELELLLIKEENPQIFPMRILSKFKWTGAKIFLYELIYALSGSGMISNGNCGINELKEFFEKIFDIDLGDVYSGFQDIKTRINPTKFLDMLKDSLHRKLDEDNK